MLTTYTTENAPFRGAILQSSQHTYASTPSTSNHAAWYSLVNALGCPEGDAQANLTCVRNASAKKIKDIIQKQQIEFPPIRDDVTYAKDPAARRASGQFAKVPVMSGTN